MVGRSTHPEIHYYGCIMLTRALQKVLVVKPKGCGSWSFPIGPEEQSEDADAAENVVFSQTGIHVREAINKADFIDAVFPPLSDKVARVYIVHSLPQKKPAFSTSSTIEDVAWRDFPAVLGLPDATPFEEEPVVPFLKDLREWVMNHHNLRQAQDFVLGRAVIYRRQHHRSQSPPKTVLAQTLASNGFVPPAFHTFRVNEVQHAEKLIPRIHREMFGCTCELHHLQTNITPEICYVEQDDAEEMAALSGVLFLTGAIDQQSKFFQITSIGQAPVQRPFWNETIAALAWPQVEGAHLNERMSYWHNRGHNMIPPDAGVQYKDILKTSASLLKSFCSKNGYELKFQFECRTKGYIGLVSIAELDFVQFAGCWKQRKRDAKDAVATMMLDVLKQKGLY